MLKSVSAVMSVCGPKQFLNRFGIFKKSFKRMPKLLETFAGTAFIPSLWKEKKVITNKRDRAPINCYCSGSSESKYFIYPEGNCVCKRGPVN